MTKDDNKESGVTKGVVIPNELDRLLDKYVKKYHYISTSEFIRTGIRDLVLKHENFDLGLQVWEHLGGKVMKTITDNFELEIANLKDSMKLLTEEHHRLKKEANLLSDDDTLQEEQNNPDSFDI